MWKQRLGNKATYQELTHVFTRAGHKDIADCVSKILGKLVASLYQSYSHNNNYYCCT